MIRNIAKCYKREEVVGAMTTRVLKRDATQKIKHRILTTTLTEITEYSGKWLAEKIIIANQIHFDTTVTISTLHYIKCPDDQSEVL